MPSQDPNATPRQRATPGQKLIWSEEHDRIIIENRGRMSASLIAELIGGGCTRSAVLGRARRLGLEKLSPHDPASSMRKRPTAPRPTVINPIIPWIPDVPPV